MDICNGTVTFLVLFTQNVVEYMTFRQLKQINPTLYYNYMRKKNQSV